MDRFTRSGLTFDVVDAGPADGPVAVLLHGFPQTSASWRRVTPLLNDAGYRTLAPDQRGYSPGARPRGRRAYTLRELTADVLAMVEGIGRFHLVGHDWGAIVAWELAAQHPDRVAALVTLSVPHPAAFRASLLSSTQLLKSWYGLAFQLPRLPEWALSRDNGRGFREAFGSSGMDAESVELAWAALGQPGTLTAALNWYRAIPFSAPSAGRIPVPTMHVWTSGDVALARRGSELSGRYVDGPYRFEALDGSHWIPEEQPSRLATLLTEWFATATL